MASGDHRVCDVSTHDTLPFCYRGRFNNFLQVIENMVARDGVEPPTPAFSGLYSAILKCLKILNLPP